MKIAEKIWEPVRRAGVRVLGGNLGPAQKRKTAPLPSILQTYGAPGVRAELLPKKTPEALRRFAETPIARKAINTIKDRVAGMNWRIQPRRGTGAGRGDAGAHPGADRDAGAAESG